MYDKQEENAIVASFILGLLLGLPVGALINFAMGLPTFPKQMPNSFFNVLIFLLTTLLSFSSVWIITTTISLTVLFMREKRVDSWQVISRVFWVILIFFPLLIGYVSLTGSIIFPPLNDFLLKHGFRLIAVHSYALLAATPFVLLYIAIVLPDSRKRIKRQLILLRDKQYRNEVLRHPRRRGKLILFIISLIALLILTMYEILT